MDPAWNIMCCVCICKTVELGMEAGLTSRQCLMASRHPHSIVTTTLNTLPMRSLRKPKLIWKAQYLCQAKVAFLIQCTSWTRLRELAGCCEESQDYIMGSKSSTGSVDYLWKEPWCCGCKTLTSLSGGEYGGSPRCEARQSGQATHLMEGNACNGKNMSSQSPALTSDLIYTTFCFVALSQCAPQACQFCRLKHTRNDVNLDTSEGCGFMLRKSSNHQVLKDSRSGISPRSPGGTQVPAPGFLASWPAELNFCCVKWPGMMVCWSRHR